MKPYPTDEQKSLVQEPDHLTGSYNYAQYLTWQFDEMVELIRGKVFKMSPAPRVRHQEVAGELHRQIANYLRRKPCKVFIAPFDVRLPQPNKGTTDEEIITVVQPAVSVICDRKKIDELGCIGAPDWIIEVLSPRTSSKDLHLKFEVYEEAGVGEYWLVDPRGQTVLVYILDGNGKYQGQLKPYTRLDKITPITLPELVINLEEVFEEESTS